MTGDPLAGKGLARGALLGAAGGTAAIPALWLATLPQRQTLAVLAEQLWAQGCLVYTGQCP